MKKEKKGEKEYTSFFDPNVFVCVVDRSHICVEVWYVLKQNIMYFFVIFI